MTSKILCRDITECAGDAGVERLDEEFQADATCLYGFLPSSDSPRPRLKEICQGTKDAVHDSSHRIRRLVWAGSIGPVTKWWELRIEILGCFETFKSRVWRWDEASKWHSSDLQHKVLSHSLVMGKGDGKNSEIGNR